jgi:hypothetical protein
MPDATLQAILLSIVNELENLRANQVLLSGYIVPQPALMDVVDEKTKALRGVAASFSKLRNDIEEMA